MMKSSPRVLATRARLSVALFVGFIGMFAVNGLADCQTPAVGGLSLTLDVNHNVSATFSYSFPGTTTTDAVPNPRHIEYNRNNQGWTFHTWVRGPADGSMTLPVDFFCLPPGTRSLKIRARRADCDLLSNEVESTLPSQSPKVLSASIAGPDFDGHLAVQAGYDASLSRPDRYVNLYTTYPSVSIGGAVVPAGVGVTNFTADAGCLAPGVYNYSVAVRQCVGTSSPMISQPLNVPFYVKPIETVQDVSLEPIPDTGKFRAVVKHHFPGSISGRHITLSIETWFDKNLVPRAGDELQVSDLLETGEQTWTSDPFDPPAGARSFTVKAAGPTCNGVSERRTTTGCDCRRSVGDPVNVDDGNVRYSDGEPLPPMIAALRLGRVYDSSQRANGRFGRGWMSMFDAQLVTNPSGNAAITIVTLTTPSNDVAIFYQLADRYFQEWPRDEGAQGTLTYDASTATYSYRPAQSNTVFLYQSGRLVGQRDVTTNHALTIAYASGGIEVTDSWSDLTWVLTTNTAGRVTGIAIDDLEWSYEYDGEFLKRVVAPGGSQWRRYIYVDDLLTEVRDARDAFIERHSYNSHGYGKSSIGPSAEITNISYGIHVGANPGETITDVTFASGNVAHYSTRPIGGMSRVVRVENGCSSCGAHNETYVHDDDGHIVRRQHANGYVTESTYDGDHLVSERTPLRIAETCVPGPTDRCWKSEPALRAAVLETTPATMITTFAYGDSNWPDRTTTIETTSVSGVSGATRRTDMTLDAATGQVLVSSTSGRTGTSWNVETRAVTTSLYNGIEAVAFAVPAGGTFLPQWNALPQPAGLRRSVDGPRPAADVADVMAWVYYPIDAAVPGVLRGRLAAAKDASGLVTRIEGYDVFGNVTRAVDANGVETEFTYDGLGRLETTTVKAVSGCDTATDPICNLDLTISRGYMGAGPLEFEEKAGGGVTKYSYDDRGRVSTIERGPSTTDLREKISYQYDASSGKKNLEVYFAKASDWIETKRDAFAYDAFDRLAQVIHDDDGDHAADDTSLQYFHGTDGMLEGVRDENHTDANTTYAYDPAGRTKSMTQKIGTGTIVTSYAYDLQGNLTSVEDPNGSVTNYVYDDFGQLLDQRSPVTNVTTYEYDFAGNVTTTTDANGATTIRTYDALNRVTHAESSLDSPSATEVVDWTYGDGSAAQFKRGRLVTMTDPAGTTTYAYERRGLMQSESRSQGGSAFVTSFEHDADGNRIAMVYPGGFKVTYAYDHAGRPLTAAGQVGSSTTPYVTSAEYRPFGPVSFIALGNGTVQSLEYDSRYRLKRNKLSGPNGVIALHDYAYDGVGNVTQINREDASLGYDDHLYKRAFSYDDLNRLTGSTTGTGTEPFVATELWRAATYEYDAMGNIVKISQGHASEPETPELSRPGRRQSTENQIKSTTHFQYVMAGSSAATTSRISRVTGMGSLTGAGPEIPGDPVGTEVGVPVIYDDAGNEIGYLLKRTGYLVKRTYSARNLLSAVEDSAESGPGPRIEYAYDGRGVRVLTDDHGCGGAVTHFYSPELRPLARLRSGYPFNDLCVGSADYDYFVWFGDRPVAQLVAPGWAPVFSRYTFADHLGTPIIQTDGAGAVIWQAEYEPFGNVHEMRVGSRTGQPLRFPGQEFAMNWEGTEENYNIFRWYRSGWGRYTQADPMGLAAGVNLYAYVDSNPVRWSDPLGLIKPVAPKDQKWRPCNNEEEQRCQASCKYGMESCMVSRTFRVIRAKNGMVVRGWVDGQMSCSCKEPSCWEQLKDWAKKWSTPDPTPLPPILPLPPFQPRPTPKPAIPGLPPFFINPCLMDPSLPPCGGPGGPA